MKSWREMKNFRGTLQSYNLMDLGFFGNHFIWSNGRGEMIIFWKDWTGHLLQVGGN